MQKEEKSLQQRHQEWVDIVNNGDAKAYAGLLTEDVVWLPPEGDPIEGREAFKQWLAPFFNRFTYNFEIDNERINIVGSRAVEKADFTSTLTPDEGGDPIQHQGTFIVLWRKDGDGVWRIERYIDDTDL